MHMLSVHAIVLPPHRRIVQFILCAHIADHKKEENYNLTNKMYIKKHLYDHMSSIITDFFCFLDESLRVCAQPGPSCCTSKMEDSYMAAVRIETQQKMRSYSFELKYLITGHTKAYQGKHERTKNIFY